MFDLLVLGSGIAGLSGAVHAARAGWSVIVLTKGELAHSATRYAQGGVAAALDDRPDDSPELHLSDTIAAGAGLCDPDAVRVLVTEGPERVRELIAMGAVFDQTGDGEAAGLALAREGGHSAARVLHAGGDATGAEIERALVAAVEATTAEVREGWLALDFLVEAGRAAGATGSQSRRGSRPTARDARQIVGKRASKPSIDVASSHRWSVPCSWSRRVSARATMSRGARSPSGCSSAMNARPCRSRRTAPSPRRASESSGRGIAGWWSAVGWNCMNSTSATGTPARIAMARPSPVDCTELVVTA